MISSAITSLYFLGRMDSNEGEIMEKEQAVLVALHIRPLIASERMQGCKDCITVIPGEPQVLIGSHRFTFDRVYGSTASPSGEIFEECVAPLVDSFFQGYNGTVLAYGQTGSGKTYTMGTGFTVGEWKEGIIPKVMQSIFLKIESLPNREEYNLKVSFIQILKEEVQDLLDSNSAPPGKQNLQIRETASGEITLAGVTEIDVFSLQEMASCLEQGSIYRATGSTNMNSCSSRSHAIFTISLERKRQWDISSVCGMFPSPKDEEDLLCAKLHLVDLAGSERAKRTGTDGLRFKEGVHINRGLLSLGNVISALGDDRKKKEGGHIPYRDSKLTRLLQDSLGGNSRTVMIACVSPADFNAEETLNTLKYANRARNIQNKPIVNHNPLTKEMLQMKQRLEFLQEELVCARISDASSVNWQAMKQKLEWLETKNAKLREELMKCQEELQIVSQQVLDTQIERDMLRLKLEEISTSNGVNYDEIEDVQETSLLKTYLTKIQEQDSELQQLCSIGSRVVDSSSLDNLCASVNKCQICVDAEAVAKEWKNAWLQYTHGEVLQELNAQLEQEEAEMKTFARSDIVMQKQHFGETNAILEAQKISLQTGRDHLMTELDSLVTTSNDKTQKIHKARMQELKQVEMQLLKEGCTAEIGMQKVKVLNLHQKMILERKTEEAATVTCHLKELLKTQKSLPKEWAEASLSNGAEGQNAEGSIQNWLDHELKVAVGIYQLRSAYEKQSDSRAAMARELGKLKDAEPQSALFLPKILSQDYPSQSITNQISSKPPSMQSLRLNFLQSMLDESSSALVDMASQLSDAEEHERTFNASARWQDVHTLGEAKNLLQLVFGAATAARVALIWL